MKVSINEHASVRIESEKGVMYFDPYRITECKNDADFIFITHSHFDHFSPEDIEKTANGNTVFVVPVSMEEEVATVCADRDRIITLFPCSQKAVGEMTVTAVPAYNTNKPMHKKEYGWLGYIVTIEGKRIYVCGDTDITEEGKNAECDIAFVPCGGTYTMDWREAAEMVNFMKPEKAIPYHYGTLVGDKDCGRKFKAAVSDGIEVEILI